MPMLPMHEHPRVEAALRVARSWYHGQDTDFGVPVLAHAVRTASILGEHQIFDPVIVAAALLHAALRFVPADIECPRQELLAVVGEDVVRAVEALTGEPPTGRWDVDNLAPDDRDAVLLIAAARKVAELSIVLEDSRAVPTAGLSSYRTFIDLYGPALPSALADLLAALTVHAQDRAARSNQ